MDMRILNLLLCLSASAVSQTISECPTVCVCYLDSKGRNVVECKQGGMIGPITFTNMSKEMEILKMTAPEDNMNELSMNPNIGYYKKLEEIHITRSNIPNLGELFFYGLTKLEVLNLSQNNITQPLPANFRGLSKLKELYLDDNRIYSIPSETFRYLIELRVLSVQKNRIEKLMTGVFRDLTKLKVLKLNGNFISDFNPEVFKDMKELRVLECRGCTLKTINPQVHELLPHLTHLDLGENELKEFLPSDFIDLPHLKVVKLDGNRATVIPNGLFANHTELKKIVLSKNALTEIAVDAFENLVNLTELDLGYNKLEHIDVEVTRPIAVTLERLVLSGNRIPIKEVQELLKVTKLRDLQLADCGVSDIDDSFVPDSVVVLNLAGNQLSYLSSYVLPDRLKDLDLSRNMFRGLDADVVDKIENVRCKLESNPWSCDLCHIIPMLDKVNKSVGIYNVRCAFPYHHANKVLGTVQRVQLSWCSAAGYSSEGVNFFLSREDGRLGIIAAGASVALLILTALAILAALCYSRRHAAKYYTHEEKRLDERESIFENQSPLFGEELSFKFPLDAGEKKITISTIDEIKKEHAISNGT